MSRRQRSFTAKHLFDRVAAAVLLMVLSPLMAVVAMAILALDGVPVLFRQRRPGLHGRPFTMFKFRTMRDTPDPAEDEARLTRLGRILRSTSLDELPELVNVLRGEMSLVGPRPLLMEYLPRYTPEQMRRHAVRPGITGWAQINGRNAIGWEERFALDLWYVDHGSFRLDLRVLCLTLFKVLSRDGVQAPGHATMPEFMGTGAPAAGDAPGRYRWLPPARRSLRISYRIIAAAVALQLSAASCVAIVDPYDVTGFARIDGISDAKTRRMERGGRVERSLRMWLSDYDTLILGGTRAWTGLDPAGRALGGTRSYNAAVPDAAMPEIDAMGRFALAHEKPKRVLISLDLSMFEADRRTRRDFDESGFDGDSMPLVYFRSLFEPASLRDALLTVEDNLRGVQAADKANGFHLREHAGHDYRRAFDEVLTKEYLVLPWHYAHFEYDAQRVAMLARLVRDFARAGIQVYVFTAPIHARQIEAMRAMGVYPGFERWLGDLARAIDEVSRDPALKGRIELWDFTGYSAATTEAIPARGDVRHRMSWFWNSSLHTPALGELVMACMLKDECAMKGLGLPLTGAILPSILQDKRAARAGYARSHPAEVAEVARLVNETRQQRQAMVRTYEVAS